MPNVLCLKYMRDIPSLLQLVTWFHVSDLSVILDVSVFFGIMKDGRLMIKLLSIFNCFTCRNLFQNVANHMSEMVKMVNRFFLSKSFILCSSDHLILFEFRKLVVNTVIMELQIILDCYC